MKKIMAFFFLAIITTNVYSVVAIPTLTQAISSGETIKFTATLSTSLPTSYSVKIDIGNNKGLVAMSCSATTCTYSTNILPNVAYATYKVGIYDSNNVLQDTVIQSDYVINGAAALPLPNYSKISNSGAVIADTAVIGIGKDDWACTKDNKTGLIWEVKANDAGIRDMKNSYTNYTKNFPATTTGAPSELGKATNIDGFVSTVNKQKLCGSSNWRLPTFQELKTLVYCSDNMYVSPTLNPSKSKDYSICTNGATTSVTSPTIFQKYFPNTSIGFYWSDIENGLWDPRTGPQKYPSNQASLVNFENGNFKITEKTNKNYVRLVYCQKDCLIKKITIPVCNTDRDEKYDVSTNSCIMPKEPVCTSGFQYEFSTNRCIRIPRPTCSNNQIYNSNNNTCDARSCTTDPSMCYKDPTPPKYPNCDPSTQYLDPDTNKCVTRQVTCNQFSPGWNSKTKSCSYK
jgi:hypothetical protein